MPYLHPSPLLTHPFCQCICSKTSRVPGPHILSGRADLKLGLNHQRGQFCTITPPLLRRRAALPLLSHSLPISEKREVASTRQSRSLASWAVATRVPLFNSFHVPVFKGNRYADPGDALLGIQDGRLASKRDPGGDRKRRVFLPPHPVLSHTLKQRSSNWRVFGHCWVREERGEREGGRRLCDGRRPWAKARWLDGEKDLDLDTGAMPSFPSVEVSA